METVITNQCGRCGIEFTDSETDTITKEGKKVEVSPCCGAYFTPIDEVLFESQVAEATNGRR